MTEGVLTPEAVGYWFFRLNGCLTTTNFVLHSARRGPQRTDADVLAVRFPHRSELADTGRPLQDHPVFDSGTLIDVTIAEVKAGRCHLNGPWTNPDRQNVEYVLNAIGILPPDGVAVAAEALYASHTFSDGAYRVRLFALGRERDSGLAPVVVQLLWSEVLGFIWQRFRSYADPKRDHSQWDPAGSKAMIRLRSGRVRLAELHWYEAHGVGKREIKRKRYLD